MQPTFSGLFFLQPRIFPNGRRVTYVFNESGLSHDRSRSRAFNVIRGTLILDVWIDERGDVACVKIVRAIPLDDQAAAEAVRQWKFTPATVGGRPIAVVQEVRVQKR